MVNKVLIRITVGIMLFFGFVLSGYAQHISKKIDAAEAERLFEKGVAFYKEGEFDKSAQIFSILVDNKVESGPIYYNLGNSYFKMGKLAYARVAYERAQQFIPRDEDLSGNIAYLRTKLEDNIELPKQNILWNIYFSPVEFLNRNELSILLLSVYGILMLVWCCAVSVQGLKKVFIPLLVLFGCISIWIGSVFFLKVTYESHPHYAVVMPNEIPVRWGNTDEDKVAFYLHSGTKVIIRQMRDNWMLITIGKDKSGWIKLNNVEVI